MCARTPAGAGPAKARRAGGVSSAECGTETQRICWPDRPVGDIGLLGAGLGVDGLRAQVKQATREQYAPGGRSADGDGRISVRRRQAMAITVLEPPQARKTTRPEYTRTLAQGIICTRRCLPLATYIGRWAPWLYCDEVVARSRKSEINTNVVALLTTRSAHHHL